MNWPEFQLARLLLSEEKVGARLRAHDRGELSEDERSKDILRREGLVS